jgi:4-amino-4-deoxy-L-arabinose transferase-like glycosyltransferase
MFNSDFIEKNTKTIALFIAVIFLSFAIGSSLTNRPQVDDAMFANASYNLAENGFFGTTMFDESRTYLLRIEQKTYWVMPLFLLQTSAFFEVLGFGQVQMRLVSVFWGLVLIGAFYFIGLKLSGKKVVGLLCMAFVGFDYLVLDTSSSGRMDLMSASLGFLALALYLVLRERNLIWAVFLSQLSVTLSGLTHPNAIIAFFAMILVTLFLDFKNLTWKHIFAAIAPYLIGGIAYGSYIFQDFEAFRSQFIDNATMSGRMGGTSSPLTSFIREFTEKYPHAFGLGMNSGGHSGPIYLKSLILLGYIIGFFALIFVKPLRENRNYWILLSWVAIQFVVMSFIDGQKQTYYLIHVIPLYCVGLAIFVHWIWNNSPVPKGLIILGCLGFFALNLGGMALRIKQNTYGNYYQPVIRFLQENAQDGKTIMGGPELGFGLKYSDKLIGDPVFGMRSGKRANYIVYDSGIEISWQEAKQFIPEFYEYLPKLLKEYEIVYENAAYKIYARR